MASPRAVVAWRDLRSWNSEPRKRKQETSRVSKRSALQIREDFVRDLDSRLWCAIERLDSVETEVAYLRNLGCETRYGVPNGQLPLLPSQNHVRIDSQSKLDITAFLASI